MKNILSSLVIFFMFTNNGICQSWNISLEVSDVTCKGANDGKMNLFVDGVDAVVDTLYTWQWIDGSGAVIDEKSDPVQHLSPGSYTVRVTRISDNATLTTNAHVGESATALEVTKSVLQQNYCAGDAAGVVQAEASGGSGGYMYGLDTGTESTEPDYTGGYTDNNGRFASLPSGTYTVWAVDSRGCEVKTPPFTINEPKAISVGYEVINAECDDTGGQIIVNSISGGTPFDTNQGGNFNFQMKWKDATNDSLIATNVASVSALPSGSYQLGITDKNSCVETLGFKVERGYKFEIVEARNVSCNLQKDGMIRCSLKANDPASQEPFSIGVKDAKGNEIVSMARSNVKSGSVIFSDLGPGAYTIEVTDALGCIKERSVSLDQPTPLKVEEILVTDIVCKGKPQGEVSMAVSGGSGHYEYSIDSGATYSVDPTFSGLLAGTYDLFVKDDGGCILNAGDAVVREPPTGYDVEEVKVTDVLCNGSNNGTIEIFFTDNTSPTHLDENKDIEWMNAAGELIQIGSTLITGLSEGTYEIIINDNYGCIYNKLISVDRRYELRADFSMNTSRFAVDYPILLEDKSLGEGIVSWLWDFGNGKGSTETNPTLTYDKAGEYIIDLTIKNEVDCSVSAQDTVRIEKGFNFIVPTAFTPNGDGLNDVFRPTFDNVTQLIMRVINTDGITVYESDDLSASWDGSHSDVDAPQGPYYYEIEFTTGSGITRKESGKVFLMR